MTLNRMTEFELELNALMELAIAFHPDVARGWSSLGYVRWAYSRGIIGDQEAADFGCWLVGNVEAVWDESFK